MFFSIRVNCNLITFLHHSSLSHFQNNKKFNLENFNQMLIIIVISNLYICLNILDIYVITSVVN